MWRTATGTVSDTCYPSFIPSMVPRAPRCRAAWWHTLVSVAQQPTNGYAERLLVPWWLWLLGLGGAAVASAEIYLGAPGFATWVPYLVLLPLTAFGLWWAGRVTVAVRDGELWVDDAHLPGRYVAEVGVLDAAGKRAARAAKAADTGTDAAGTSPAGSATG